MHRSIPLTILVGLVLVLAGCLGGSTGSHGVNPAALVRSSGSVNQANVPGVAFQDAVPCLPAVQAPTFAAGSSVKDYTGQVPVTATRYVLDVTSYHGGIYLAPTDNASYDVQVATTNAPQGAVPVTVTGNLVDGTYHLNVSASAPVGLPALGTGAEPMVQVKVLVPNVPWNAVTLHTAPSADLNNVPAPSGMAAPASWPVLVQGIQGGPLSIASPLLGANLTNLAVSGLDVQTPRGAVNVDGAVGAYSVAVNATATCLSSVTGANLHLSVASSSGVHLDGVRAANAWIVGTSSSAPLSVMRSVLTDLRVSLGSSDVTLDHVGFQTADLQVAGGNVNATLIPSATGILNATATTVAVTLPAGPSYGVSATLSSSSGSADAHLANGTTTSTASGVTATTKGFAHRAIQTTVNLAGQGDVVLRTMALVPAAQG